MQRVLIVGIFLILVSCTTQKQEKFNSTYLIEVDSLYTLKTYRGIENAQVESDTLIYKIVVFNKGIKDFSGELYTFPYLNVLEISFNNLTTLPDDIGQFQYLQCLFLNRNAFEDFPQEVYNIQHLKQLSLDNNQISQIPNSINRLSSIEELYLERNSISSLPDSLFGLRQLKILKLNHNQLENIPKGIAKLVNLEKLYLSNNKLTQLPEGLSDLPKLKYLEIERNKIPRDQIMAFVKNNPQIKVSF